MTGNHYTYNGNQIYTTPEVKEVGNQEEWLRRNSFWGNFHRAMAESCRFDREGDFSAAGEIIVAGPAETIYKCQRCGCETISDVALCWTCVDEVLHKEEKNGQSV